MKNAVEFSYGCSLRHQKAQAVGSIAAKGIVVDKRGSILKC